MYLQHKVQIFTLLLSVLLIIICGHQRACAEVVIYGDQYQWGSDVGEFTTIDFTHFDEGTIITEQYADLGIHFTSGYDFIRNNWNIFPNDGWGLTNNTYAAAITTEYDFDLTGIAVEYPGAMQIELYHDNELLYTSLVYGAGFLGLISDIGFDKAVILDPTGGSVSVDDLHFGGVVPSAGTCTLLLLMGIFERRRRQH